MSIERKNPAADLATDGNQELGVETTVAAPKPSSQDEDPMTEKMSTEEVLSTFSPNSNRIAERVYEQYNPDQLVQANDPTVNGYAVENRTNKHFSYLDDLFDEFAGLSEEEKKQKKLEASLSDAALDAHEERMEEQRKELSQQDRDILSNQHIKMADGKSLSVLDIVDSLDRMLNNWDDTFNEMVDQGIADPKDKNKLYKNMTKYRNMMADPNLSEQEKQKLREQMIRDGLLTQEQMNYADAQAKNKEDYAFQKAVISQEQAIARDSLENQVNAANVQAKNKQDYVPSNGSINNVVSSIQEKGISSVSPGLSAKNIPEMRPNFTSAVSPLSSTDNVVNLEQKPTQPTPIRIAQVDVGVAPL